MNNIIYAYKKKDNNKIVYVGQTTDIISRHKQHIKYDPFNINNKEFDYPLSRGIRKYGEDMYELIILEDNLKKEQLNEREIYWIKFYNTYYNGYNQYCMCTISEYSADSINSIVINANHYPYFNEITYTITDNKITNGYDQSTGGSNPVKPIFSEEKIDTVIEMLKDESYSYQDIINKTGVSMTHIYNINTGKRRKRDDLQYPIRQSNTKGTRGLKFSQEECEKIHQ